MNAIEVPTGKLSLIKNTAFDVLALSLIYFLPSISHLLMLPVYFIEPMRLVIILSMAHSNKFNTYFLAFTLPVFSFFLSEHPIFPKMLLITSELVLNIFLFNLLNKKMKNMFGVALLSILLSKAAYYFFKYLLMEASVLNTEFIATPIFIQIVTTVFYSLYIAMIFRRKQTLN